MKRVSVTSIARKLIMSIGQYEQHEVIAKGKDKEITNTYFQDDDIP